MKLRNNCVSLFRNGVILKMYSFNVNRGQSEGSGVYTWIVRGLPFVSGLLVLVCSNI